MDTSSISKRDIAECVGLWLAEGDNKTKSELTFTNNCWELVEFFSKIINNLFSEFSYNPRIYVYSPEDVRFPLFCPGFVIKYYIDKRATRSYFIFRLCSVKIVRKWHNFVRDFLDDEQYYASILRGFFAGEGSLKHVSHDSRVLRIAQKKQKLFINHMLKTLGITFSFYAPKRNYEIWGRCNWDIFAYFKLADLHPEKKARFWKIYSSFKQYHYSEHYIYNNLLTLLDSPHSTRQLAKKLNRSPARIGEILNILKLEEKVENFRVGSLSYWTKDVSLVIISKLKGEYLDFLSEPRVTLECANKFKVVSKSASNRLKELEKLGLVTKSDNGQWIRTSTEKKMLII